MNGTLKNLIQQIEEGEKGKKIPSGTVVNEEISQQEQQLGPLQQCNNLVDRLHD